jgi:hypothetical protein
MRAGMETRIAVRPSIRPSVKEVHPPRSLRYSDYMTFFFSYRKIEFLFVKCK